MNLSQSPVTFVVMARWDDELSDHPARSALDQLGSALESAPTPEKPEALDELERIRQIHGIVVEALDDADPGLIQDRTGTLNAIQKQAQAAAGHITTYSESDNPQSITDATPAIEALFPPLARLRNADLRPSESVAEDATRYRQQVGQLVRRLKEETSEAKGDVDTLRAEVNQTKEKVKALNSELDARIMDWENANDEFRSRQKEGFEALHSRQEEKFTRIHDQLSGDLQKTETEYREKAEDLSSQWADRRAELESTAEEIIDNLSGLLENAEDLAGKIAETGLAGRYLSASEDESKAAFWWYVAAFVFALALVGGAGWFLFIYRPGELGLGESIRRAVLILIGSALPVAAFREASGHRASARTYRRLYIELASLPLYLADLEDEQVNEQKLNRIPHYFPGRSWSDRSPDGGQPYRSGLLGLTRKRRSGKRED